MHLQALTAFCSIANGGKIMQPYVVSKVIDENGYTVLENTPTAIRTVISQETCDIMNEYLQAVVEEGTGKKAKVAGYKIAGKSGTGEQGDRSADRYTITFIGYFPADDPKAAMLVVIDKPDEYADGVTTAAPCFGNTAKKILEYMNIKPEGETAKSDDISMPLLTGMSVSDASSALENLGIHYTLVGTGETITNQFPKEGESISENTAVVLYS